MAIEYSVQFIEKIKRTSASTSYRFKMSDITFKAGQYMLVNLGNDLVHPLSISNCPTNAKFIEFTKRMTGSPYCQRLESLEKGEVISLKGPLGKFIFDDSENVTVLIAGGIGITPIRSILTELEQTDENLPQIILIYGNLNIEDIAFRDELEDLNIPGFHLVHVLSDTTGVKNAYQGFINSDVISKEVPDVKEANYMVSGPPAMVNAIKKALESLDVSEDKIITDLFLGYD